MVGQFSNCAAAMNARRVAKDSAAPPESFASARLAASSYSLAFIEMRHGVRLLPRVGSLSATFEGWEMINWADVVRSGWRYSSRQLRSKRRSASRRHYVVGQRRSTACEQLEVRTLLTAYVVDTIADNPTAGSGVMDAKISLREAITAANTNAAFGDAAAGQADLTGGPNGDTITFAASLDGQTITLGGVELTITDELLIAGPGATLLTVSGGGLVASIFRVNSDVTAAIEGLTITRGSDTGIRNSGRLTLTNSVVTLNSSLFGNAGGISNDGMLTITNSSVVSNFASASGGGIDNSGTLAVIDSTVSGNTSLVGSGGGIRNYGTLTLVNTTVSGNTAGDAVVGPPCDGGGIHSIGTLTLANSTISGNQASRHGGGIYSGGTTTLRNVTVFGNLAGTLGDTGTGGGIFITAGATTLFNSLVAGNALGLTAAIPNDIFGTLVATSSHNLIGDAATAGGLTDGAQGNIVGVNWRTVLDPTLRDNGGSTLTHALRLQSAALDAGSNAEAIGPDGNPLATDQRGTGFPRILEVAVDIGAFEGATSVRGLRDFNGDGLEDVAEMMSNGWWWVGRSDGAGSFTKELWTVWADAETWAHVGFGDFNGDGWTDIFGVTVSGGIWVGLTENVIDEVHGIRTTRWLAPTTAVQNWIHIAVGDFDGNGDDDIAGLAADGTWHVGLSDGGTSFVIGTEPWDVWAPDATWLDVETGDFNGDGLPDIAGLTVWGGWWVGLNNALGGVGTPNTGAFTHRQWAKWADASKWADLEVGDFNGDGSDDVSGFDISGNWWIGTSHQTGFETGPLSADWESLPSWGKIGVGDFNDDGFTDLVGLSTWGGWWVGLNSTSGGFNTSRWALWQPIANWAQLEQLDVSWSQRATSDEAAPSDAVGFNQDGDWRVGVSNGTDALVGDAFWANWDPAATWATLNDALTRQRRLDRLALV